MQQKHAKDPSQFSINEFKGSAKPLLADQKKIRDEENDLQGVLSSSVKSGAGQDNPYREASEQGDDEEKPNRSYLIWAFLGAVLIALASMIRGVEASEPFPAKFTFSLCYFILSASSILYLRWKGGSDFRYPWYRCVVAS